MDVVLQRRLARRATHQLGLITRTQLIQLGVSPGQVPRLVKSGRLREHNTGVFLIAGAPANALVDLAAACLATSGVASHRSAANLDGLLDTAPSRPELTVGLSHGTRNTAILHRSSDLVRSDIRRIEGIPSTNATRTLIDLGAVVPSSVLETALERALHQRLTTFDRLVKRFFEVARRGRPGVGPLRALLVDRDPVLAPAESDLETLLFRILREHGLPEPVRQYEVVVDGRLFHLDVAYPELKMFIEGDGFGVHTTRQAFENDRERQNLLVIAGWLPLRFTWRQLCHKPGRVATLVADARDRRLHLIS